MQLREMLKLGENYLKMRNFSSREHTTEKKTTQGMEADIYRIYNQQRISMYNISNSYKSKRPNQSINKQAVCSAVLQICLFNSIWMAQTQRYPLLQPPTTLQPFYSRNLQNEPLSYPRPLGQTPFFELNSLIMINHELPDHQNYS